MSSTNDPLIRQLKLQDAVLKRDAEKSLYSFVQQAWPILEPEVPFVSNWHIEYVVEHLQAVTAGQITRLLINMPPRYMKSLLVSVFWPTWDGFRRRIGAGSSRATRSPCRSSIPWIGGRFSSRPGISGDGGIGSNSPRIRT